MRTQQKSFYFHNIGDELQHLREFNDPHLKMWRTYSFDNAIKKK
jgi:hypothetical protein